MYANESADTAAKPLWNRVKFTFSEKDLWILAERSKFPYNQWAAKELSRRSSSAKIN
jgi:hypothetical protein